MGNAIISRNGDDCTVIKFDNYNPGITGHTSTEMNQARDYLAVTTVGNYSLFAGGYNNGSYYSTVDAYNSSLTKSTPTVLSIDRRELAATTVGNYALFGGGYNNGTYSSAVDAYNGDLARSTPTVLSVERNKLSQQPLSVIMLYLPADIMGVLDFLQWMRITAV